jgi:hypothetical protein
MIIKLNIQYVVGFFFFKTTTFPFEGPQLNFVFIMKLQNSKTWF